MSAQAVDALSVALPLNEALRKWVPDNLWAKYDAAVVSLRHLSRPHSSFLTGPVREALGVQAEFRARRSSLEKAQWNAAREIIDCFDAKVRCGELIVYLTRDLFAENARPLPRSAWSSIQYGFGSHEILAPRRELWFAYVRQAEADANQPNSERFSPEIELALKPPSKILIRPLHKVNSRGELSGANYSLLKPLVEARAKDIADGCPPDEHRVVHRDALTVPSQSPNTFSKTVSRCRRTFAKWYSSKVGEQPAKDLLIETGGDGNYRLGRSVRVIDVSDFD